MMRKPELLLYRLIVWMHPPAFRNDCGREMLLDFEDAVGHLGIARVCGDALLSVARQWARCAVSGGADRRCEAQPSLLAGQYAPVRDQPLNAFELSRGLCASLVLLGLCGYWLGHGASRARHIDVVYAASQKPGAGQKSGADQSAAVGRRSGSSPAAAAPNREFKQFNVISIRENKNPGPAHINFPMSNDEYYKPTHGYMQSSSLPLSAYIQFAYKMDALQVVAFQKQLPDWATSTRYDIEARVEGDPGKDDMRQMVRALLASRFKLQLHTESTMANVYDLKVAHPGKIGPSLHAHAADDVNCENNHAERFFSPCGAIGFVDLDSKMRIVRMAGRKVTFEQFDFYATTNSGRPVLNKTGLTGAYDFTLEYSRARIGGPPDAEAADAPGLSFQDAIQEQLGLKLVPDKGPVTTYVLDHVEKPTEN
jgi:uncharacterized protein (TIGR03435 family)